MGDHRGDQVSIINLVMALRRQGILDQKLLVAMERTPRENFVPDYLKYRAYDDSPLPIPCGQTMTEPVLVARMIQAAEVDERHKVLEVGTGSGYQTAVLSRLCRRCYTIERYRALMKAAERSFARLKIDNIATRIGDGSAGWPEQEGFDRILVNAAMESVPETLTDQLKPNGILIVPLTKSPDFQSLVKIRRTSEGTLESAELQAVRFVPLQYGLPKEG